jgi:hypothetical protein
MSFFSQRITDDTFAQLINAARPYKDSANPYIETVRKLQSLFNSPSGDANQAKTLATELRSKGAALRTNPPPATPTAQPETPGTWSATNEGVAFEPAPAPEVPVAPVPVAPVPVPPAEVNPFVSTPEPPEVNPFQTPEVPAAAPAPAAAETPAPKKGFLSSLKNRFSRSSDAAPASTGEKTGFFSSLKNRFSRKKGGKHVTPRRQSRKQLSKKKQNNRK